MSREALALNMPLFASIRMEALIHSFQILSD